MAGPDNGPESPFPVQFSGRVIKGFGRGSKELGIPTANISLEGLTAGGHESLATGVYYGWAGLENEFAKRKSIVDKAKLAGAKVVGGLGSIAFGSTDESGTDDSTSHHGHVYPMVMSIGWNPFYKNTVRSVEVHLIHEFDHDFYGRHLNVLVLGDLRPEKDYESKESLIDDIKQDIAIAGKSLGRPAYAAHSKDKFLQTFPEPVAPTNATASS